MTIKYNLIECPNCLSKRKGGDLQGALICSRCSGNGILKEVFEILCNNCGKNIIKSPETCRAQSSCSTSGNLIGITVDGNYDSFYLFDGTSYTFSICEECLRNMFENFKIKPKVVDYIMSPGYGSDEEVELAEEKAYERDSKAFRERVIKHIIE